MQINPVNVGTSSAAVELGGREFVVRTMRAPSSELRMDTGWRSKTNFALVDAITTRNDRWSLNDVDMILQVHRDLVLSFLSATAGVQLTLPD
jgi:hypothetical protein